MKLFKSTATPLVLGSTIVLAAAGIALFRHVRQRSWQAPASWDPPQGTGLPQAFLDNTAFLLKHGMADPRGGKPVEATTPFGKKTGWLVIAKHYLAAIDGLEYPTYSEVKDLDQDALLAACRATLPPQPAAGGRNFFYFNSNTSLLGAAMLAVHGETSAAASMVPSGTATSRIEEMDLDYLQHRVSRECEAFNLADDKLVLKDAEALSANRSAFAALPQFQPKPSPPVPPHSTPPAEPLAFLNISTQVARDAQRHLDAGEPPAPDINAIEKLPQSERIQKLIQALEYARPTGWSNPGGPMWFQVPVLDALRKEGPAAVEPLIDTYEHDQRLTREVIHEMHIPSPVPLGIVSVKQIAWVALRQTQLFDALSNSGQAPTSEELTAYWSKFKGLTPQEAWFKVLQTDGSGERNAQIQEEQQWLGAARHMVDPVGRVRFGNGGYTNPPPVPGETPALQGEPLRSKQNPSVTDLMAKRAGEMAAPPGGSTDFGYEFAGEMCVFLAKWDPAHALPTLQTVSQTIMKGSPGNQRENYGMQQFGRTLGEVINARIKLGDTAAAEEFATWAEQQPPAKHDAFGETLKMFLPMLDNPTNSAFEKAQQMLFGNPDSGWNPVIQLKAGETFTLSPLLELPGYFDSVLSGLKDKTVVGKTTREGNQVRVGPAGYGLTPDEMPVGGPAKEETECRVCDVLAYHLYRLEGAPKFQPFWPTEKRDQVIGELSAFLVKHRSYIRSVIPWPYNWEDPSSVQRRGGGPARK